MENKKFPVLILDFGSQYTQLIARKIREQGIYSKIVPFNISYERVAELDPGAIVFSGGPSSVYDEDAPDFDEKILELKKPILGICYGMGLLISKFGGSVERLNESREYGKSEVSLLDDSILFADTDKKQIVWMSHGDSLAKLPDGFKKIAVSDNAVAALGNKDLNIYLVQFHPEVKHSQFGEQILANFLFKISGLKKNWDIGSFIDQKIAEIKEIVGTEKVVCGVSGGVDSSVMALLMHKALGDQLKLIFVDNGLLRKNERINVENRFKNNFDLDILTIDGTEKFLGRLSGVVDPEKKRKIIGDTFLDLFFDEAENYHFLAQGTLYPDVIESGGEDGSPAETIKTHHNRVEKVLELIRQNRVIEPFKELFKDEVRVIGEKLGMAKELVQRQPFPGPGLAIRIIGEVTPDRLAVLRDADAILIEELKNADYYYKAWQSFAVLLPVRSVGVMGDSRTYGNVLAIRSVESSDGMTSEFSRFPYDLLGKISSRIINNVTGINRVVYDISSKPPATIEWE